MTIRLKHIARITKGRTTAGAANVEGNGVPFITMNTLRATVNTDWINDTTADCQKGDIVVCWDGSNAGEFFRSKFTGVLASTIGRVKVNGKFDNKYIYFLLKSNEGGLRSNIVGMGIPHVNPFELKNIAIPSFDLPTQRAIADFLDRETARIDTLIEKKQRLVELVAPRFEALVHEARSCGEWKRFENCSRNVSRSIPNDANGTFVPLGLYSRGRGFFVKPETAYDDLGDSSFYFVEKGDLVFSGQFAWEGAVGLVSSSEHGCVVSHRYPVYKGVEGVMSEYLYAYFRSHHGQFLMDNCSRGAAGRNRPLNTRVLHKEKIAIPSVSLQAEVAKVVSFEWKLKTKIAPSIDRLKEYRSALITSAVTGQIDVTKWANAGTTDRQLDAIEEEFGA